jgi:hypothetical protein
MCEVWLIFLTNLLSIIIATCLLSLVLYAVRIEENIALFLYLILYRCIPDPILCHVGN